MPVPSAPPLRVAVSGARGKVGREVVGALAAEAGLLCVAEIEVGDDLVARLVDSGAAFMVDFTTPAAGVGNAIAAADAGVAPIVGTTGLGGDGVERIRGACLRAGTGGCVAPNFALGAALLMWLADLCAPHFDHVEVVETHNPSKADAPSGTALRTAERLVAARGGRPFSHREPETTPLAGTRGGVLGGVGVHSLRLAGSVADQEVVFGATGQTLTLAHRTTSRAAFAPGVIAAVRAVAATARFYDSLEAVLGLPDPASLGSLGVGGTGS